MQSCVMVCMIVLSKYLHLSLSWSAMSDSFECVGVCGWLLPSREQVGSVLVCSPHSIACAVNCEYRSSLPVYTSWFVLSFPEYKLFSPELVVDLKVWLLALIWCHFSFGICTWVFCFMQCSRSASHWAVASSGIVCLQLLFSALKSILRNITRNWVIQVFLCRLLCTSLLTILMACTYAI